MKFTKKNRGSNILNNLSYYLRNKFLRKNDKELKLYLDSNFHHVFCFGNDNEKFYVCCIKDKDINVYNACIIRFKRLFESPHSSKIRSAIGKNFVFVIGQDGRQLEYLENEIEKRFNKYVMSMKTPEWPFKPCFSGIFSEKEIKKFNSSFWRPRGECATIEETFHTLTETCNRLYQDGCSDFSDWSFEKKGKLGKIMKSDIDKGYYDIEKQNKQEGGNYDFKTAVNEYIHQIWICYVGGHEKLLNRNKQEVIQIMKDTPGFPMFRASDKNLCIKNKKNKTKKNKKFHPKRRKSSFKM